MLNVASKMLNVASKMLNVASKMLALRQGSRNSWHYGLNAEQLNAPFLNGLITGRPESIKWTQLFRWFLINRWIEDTMDYELYSDVILLGDIPEAGLYAGDIGTVVEKHNVAELETGYSVEFFDMLGNTVAVMTLPESSLRSPNK